MSVADDYRAAVAALRGWGFQVTEWSGCYGRSNGSGWSAGKPVGHVNHHYVCSLNPDQGYINNLVSSLANGSVVNWFADVHGVAYLIGTGPMNHAGTGNQSVLDRTRSDQAPLSNPASGPGSISGNSHYSGTECQHPGDSTPWPQPLLDVMVAINAAEFNVWGYTANRAINHSEWTNRKIDMSAGGGTSSGGWAGDELRRRVAARMTGSTPPDEGDWLDMVSKEELQAMLNPIQDAANRADWGVNDPNNGARVMIAAVQNTTADIQGRQIPTIDAHLAAVNTNVVDIQGRQIPLVDSHVIGLYDVDGPESLAAAEPAEPGELGDPPAGDVTVPPPPS
jgi:hypothetical protein